MEKNIEIHPSIMSSKGQITVPKEVREFMKLQTGSVLSFKIDKGNNIVTVEKGLAECKFCKGAKTIDDKVCPMCEGKGTLEGVKSLFQYFEVLSKSEIYASLIHEEILGDKRIKRKIPLVKVTSTVYPEKFLNAIQDHLQFMAIYEFCKGIKIGLGKADDTITLEEILECLTLEENKKKFAKDVDYMINPFKKAFEAFFEED